MGFLSTLMFANPLILFALAGLPVIWFLLRVIPPRPRVIVLPSVKFLAGLIPARTSPSHTPWWILLLRLMMLAFLIVALSGPVLNPGSDLEKGKPLTIIMDNGWSAGPVWDRQVKQAAQLAEQAAREDIPVMVFPTAAKGGEAQDPPRLLPASEALALIKGLAPKPWNTDYPALIETLPQDKGQVFWLNDGIAHKSFEALSAALGPVSLFHPAPESLALALKIKHSLSGVEVSVQKPSGAASLDRPVSVQALGPDGRVLGFQSLTLNDSDEAPVFFDMPEALRGEVSQYRLAGSSGAGGVFLLDESFQRRAVGVAAPAEEGERAPLVEAGYYLRRALEPYADLAFAPVDKLTEQNRSMIILPDVAAMPLEELNALETWVEQGGLLLRFAGPSMAENVKSLPLMPVALRAGGRALDGSLTWDKPLKIKSFDEKSPFAGLEIPKDVVIRQQVLPDISEDLEGKVWAALEDGTPLITAAPYGKGLLVLVHTTASAEWSDLPLSGLFVDILRRLAAISNAPSLQKQEEGAGTLDPLMVLDGFGVSRKPDASVKPLEAKELLDGVKVGPQHPPGIYGRAGLQKALNVGEGNFDLKALGEVPADIRKIMYDTSYEISLSAPLLFAAAMLLLLDWIVMILLTLQMKLRFGFAGLIFLVCLSSGNVHADDLQYANALYLAYVKTGDERLDSTSQQGLESLSRALTSRTSAEPKGVAALNIETDNLAFFPWLYWPVSAGQKAPDAKILQKIQAYLDHGGTILFDLRYGAGQDAEASANLQKITGALNIPPLQEIPADHVLTKTFYLLDSFPGRHTTGVLWVEKGSAQGRDGVSSVIIGSNDWAAAWAAEGGEGSLPGGSRQGEMATRVGVNIMMYALTGNYKADQVHVPYILERLER